MQNSPSIKLLQEAINSSLDKETYLYLKKEDVSFIHNHTKKCRDLFERAQGVICDSQETKHWVFHYAPNVHRTYVSDLEDQERLDLIFR